MFRWDVTSLRQSSSDFIKGQDELRVGVKERSNEGPMLRIVILGGGFAGVELK